MKRFTMAIPVTVGLLLLLTMGTQRTSASALHFVVNSNRCGGDCLANGSSGGSITVADLRSGVVLVNLLLGSAKRFVHTGFGFSLAGRPTDAFPDMASGFAPAAGSMGMGGPGNFEYRNGSNRRPGLPDFTITGTGLSTASFEQNAAGKYDADDLPGGGNTGVMEVSVPAPSTNVPDGGMTFLLLGGALAGLESLRRRVKA